MMFELLLQVRQTLNTPGPLRSIGGLEIFEGSKPMILPLSIERPSQRPIPYAGLPGDGHGLRRLQSIFGIISILLSDTAVEISSLQSSNRCAHGHESYRTLRDGSFGVRCPRHFVPGYDHALPPGRNTFRTGALIRLGSAGAFRKGVASIYETQMPEKNCYLVAAVHARPLFSSAEFAVGSSPQLLGPRQVSLDE